MFTLNPPYALWSIWRQLSFLQHVFVLALCAVTGYSAFATIITTMRLRSLGNRDSNGCVAFAKDCVASLHNLCANVRQAVGAVFYLFGAVLFLGFQTVGRAMENSLAAQILGNFILNCAFAANVFLIFLVLALVQWFLCTMLNTCSERLRRLENNQQPGCG